MEDREALARAYDPEAFEDHPIEARSQVAAIQWAARRHLANEAADRLLASGWLTERDKRTVIEYEERRNAAVLVTAIDGQPAAEWMVDHDRKVAKEASSAALREAARVLAGEFNPLVNRTPDWHAVHAQLLAAAEEE